MSQPPQMRNRKTVFTAEELSRLPRGRCRYELVKGELFEMPPAGGRHGNVAMQIGSLLNAHVRANQIGYVLAAETGYFLRRDPDTVRAPGASFIAGDRLPTGELPPGYLDIMPDLAVEVLSPNDRAGEVLDKVEDWLRSGVKLVWVLDTAARTVRVYRSTGEVQELAEHEILDGAEVIPGFTCEIRDLFI